eukprot:599701-Rhodomonas_salina.3
MVCWVLLYLYFRPSYDRGIPPRHQPRISYLPMPALRLVRYQASMSYLPMPLLRRVRYQPSAPRDQILIRHVDADDEVIARAVKSVKKRGFVNYFGHQRFGPLSLGPPLRHFPNRRSASDLRRFVTGGHGHSGLPAVRVGNALVKGGCYLPPTPCLPSDTHAYLALAPPIGPCLPSTMC